jgi:hypothetical protein
MTYKGAEAFLACVSGSVVWDVGAVTRIDECPGVA